jgi:hypothetical protein
MDLSSCGTSAPDISSAFIISPEYLSCSGVTKVKAKPLFPALPVRLEKN